MLQYNYTIQANNKSLSAFVYGDTWLIGATSENSTELLKRLRVHLNDKIDEQSIKKTIYEYIEWFKKDYEKSKSEPYPYEDDEIVSGVGIILLKENGLASLFKIGNFSFSMVSDSDDIADIIGSSIMLKENHVLIADPKKANIATKIKPNTETSIWSYSFPVAVIHAIPKPSQHKRDARRYIKYILGSVFVAGLCTLFWLNSSTISSFLQNKHDSTSTLTNIDFVKAVPDIHTSANKPAGTVDALANSAEYRLESSENLLVTVQGLIDQGLNAQAIQKLDSLETSLKILKLTDHKNQKSLDGLLNKISLFKKALSNNVGF